MNPGAERKPIVRKLLVLAALAVAAYALPKVLARSNTRVHRINQLGVDA